MLAIQALPQPVIARVHGVATAAGCQIVAGVRPCRRVHRGAFRDLRHQLRPVLRDAGRSGLAQRIAQARVRDAVHRRVHRRCHRGRLGPGQQRRAAAGAGRASSARMIATIIEKPRGGRRGGQGAVLRADRGAACAGVRCRQQGDHAQHAGRRRGRGRWRVPREAQAEVAVIAFMACGRGARCQVRASPR